MGRALGDDDIAFVERLAVAASLHDRQGLFLYLNSAGERASGLKSADLLGRSYTHTVPEEARDHVVSLFQRALKGETTDFETVFHDGEGCLRGVHATHLPLKDGDDVIGVLICAFDVRQPIGNRATQNSMPELTPRQFEVLELIAAGRSTTDIAEHLFLSIETVRNHLRATLRELGVHTRVEAVAAARRLGLLSPRAFDPES